MNAGAYGIVEPFEKDSAGKEEEEHPMEMEKPYHSSMHHMVVLKQTQLIESYKINTTLSYQHDERKELEPGNVESNPFLGFRLNQAAADMNVSRNINTSSSVVVGFQYRIRTIDT
jgi:hypothetical protein